MANIEHIIFKLQFFSMSRFAAILLSCVVLIANVSLTIGTHYCGGKAVKTAVTVGVQDLSCDMSMSPNTCSKSNKKSGIHRKACCENQYSVLTTDHEYNKTEIQVPELTASGITLWITTSIFKSFVADYSIPYEPPPPSLAAQDVAVLFQVFRL